MTSAPSTRTRRPAAETREHVLDVAEDLFYRLGIHATGVDTVAAQAGVAPTTLYRLFGSKDDLVAAYVERYAAGYRDWIESITSDPDLSARDRILALFDALTDATRPETFRGCPFLMALAEYPDPASAAHVSAQTVKAWVRGKLHALTVELPGQTRAGAPVLADQLALVVEGLYASTAALGSAGPAQHARALAAVVLDAAGQRRPGASALRGLTR
ncbi:MAG TPA: TetR/AcrR family transcriptional regulator [Micromonosporaceae bacterium]